jgi:hypothetical protein
MVELKTQKNDASVENFLSTISDETQRADSHKLLEIFAKQTGEEPRMWGSAIVGFGQYHYKYESGREADWMLAGFSPRKAALTLYLSTGFEMDQDLLSKLGKHKLGKGCLYIKRLSDIDEDTLKLLITASYQEMKQRNP